jgi:predicted adenine nucleotide alpha hydrolase (AANH) superfamily ATPase
VQAGERAAADHGVEFVYIDFRPGFREGQTKARELGLYRQPYCGCVYSEKERYHREKKREVRE